MEIIFFAIVAALVLGRLYQVLGQNHGAEPPKGRTPTNFARDEQSNPVALGDDTLAPTEETNVVAFKPHVYNGAGAAGILAISSAQKGFSPESFVEGARQAYVMIVSAYGVGDEAALKPLVDQDVFEAYKAAMEQRRTENAAKIDVVRISSAQITDASLVGNVATIDVAFCADLADGGDGLRGVDEIWTFERVIDSRDPNWLLSAVQTK